MGRNKLHPGLLAAPVWGNSQPREARQTLSVRKSSVQQPYALSETGLHYEEAHLFGGLFLGLVAGSPRLFSNPFSGFYLEYNWVQK